MSIANRRILPGFRLSLSFALTYLAVLILVPLAACFVKASTLTWTQFWTVVSTPRVRDAYVVTFGTSIMAAAADLVLGLLIAWVMVRYEFPLKRFFDSLIDLPFALPTAVAGLVYSALYAKNGWFGQYLFPLGIEAVNTRLAIVLVLTFIGLPFVVRTVEPVLESLEAELEEAAACLGATRWQTFTRVIFPPLVPALITGFALSVARGIGEYGSVIFVSGNKRFMAAFPDVKSTEIAPVLIVERLDAHEYAEATAVAVVLLLTSFVLLGVINHLERRSQRHAG
ncbi:MAG: sulfate ABC transporter permease subunit CysT [Planctomycetia bacterium]|nr:sulfate ABC transporter permease subunit CysT [Planctomycetia bacterium]